MSPPTLSARDDGNFVIPEPASTTTVYVTDTPVETQTASIPRNVKTVTVTVDTVAKPTVWVNAGTVESPGVKAVLVGIAAVAVVGVANSM